MRKTGMLKRHKCIPIRNSRFLVSTHTQVECFLITITFQINNQILVMRADIKADAHLNLCGFKHVLYYRTELWSPMCKVYLVHKRIFRKYHKTIHWYGGKLITQDWSGDVQVKINIVSSFRSLRREQVQGVVLLQFLIGSTTLRTVLYTRRSRRRMDIRTIYKVIFAFRDQLFL